MSIRLLTPSLWLFCVSRLLVHTHAAPAELLLIPGGEPLQVFAGKSRNISVTLRNSGDAPVDAQLRARIFQASSTTVIFVGEASGKALRVLPGQTVLETAAIDFPVVKTETRFLLQWTADGNRVPGRTEVLVYPTTLLTEMKPLAGDEGPGVFDPHNQIKPLLKHVAVDFVDLAEAGFESFRGKLAILGPFESEAAAGGDLREKVQALAKNGVAVVWVQPPGVQRGKLLPSHYMIHEHRGTIVVAQAELISNLPENPQSHINLIDLSRLALDPEPLRLPEATP